MFAQLFKWLTLSIPLRKNKLRLSKVKSIDVVVDMNQEINCGETHGIRIYSIKYFFRVIHCPLQQF